MTKITISQGDITKQDTDAIVNAANSQLAHGGGVARAIADKAEADLVRESSAAPHVPTGQVYATTGGNLRAKYVIHAVGPVWQGGRENEADLLASCIRNALHTADELGCGSISFPAISTGIFGYPLRQAASVILSSIIETEKEISIDEIRIVLFTSSDYETFQEVFETLR